MKTQQTCTRFIVYIIDKSENATCYQLFALQIECLEWLLDNGGSVADRDDLGGTPAHDAAEQGQVYLISYIVQSHNDAMYFQIEALELLVNKGADVSIIDDEGLSPMDVAKENQQDECVEMLFKITQPVFTVRTPVIPIAVTIPYIS